MAEQVNLTRTAFADPRTTDHYQVTRLVLDWRRQLIQIELLGDNEVHQFFEYIEDEARNLMTMLNKLDLSAKSLHRRILEKLIADGHLDGSISGTPD